MKESLILLLTIFHMIRAQDDTEDEVSEIIYTGSGAIQGREVTIDNKTHYEFLGIPYAEPPVGRLRFKPPVPVRPWSQVLQATSDGPACIQQSVDYPGYTPPPTSEDCLTLNIFTNSVGLFRKKPQAVMVFIHGGGFNLGSKSDYRMQGLVDEDVVYVAMNYRLGALGFMSFGNNIVSGNMGLKDQNLAIQWVRYNIHHFGGDPARITIFGESAGAISVHAHVLSPWSNGLLSGAIAQSGSLLYLNIDPRGIEKKFTFNAVSKLGCPKTLDQSTLECLQKLDFEKVFSEITDPDEAQTDPSVEIKYLFMPVVDDYADNPFLPIEPLQAMKTGMFNRIPFMSGTVTNEGGLQTLPVALTGVRGAAMRSLIELPAKSGFYINYGQSLTFNKVAAMFYNYAQGDSDLEQEQPVMDFFTDVMFLSGEQKSLDLMGYHVRNLYNYYMTQQTNQSILSAGALPIEYTPLHADDLTFLVTDPNLVNVDLFSEHEKSTSRHMVKYWTNFAKYGTPSHDDDDDTPVWYPVNNQEKNYMELNAEPEMKKSLHSERMLFWEKMLWQEREQMVDRSQLYIKTTQFLINGYNTFN